MIETTFPDECSPKPIAENGCNYQACCRPIFRGSTDRKRIARMCTWGMFRRPPRHAKPWVSTRPRRCGVREIRPDAELTVDVNQAWNERQLYEFTPQLAELGVKLIEQPLPLGKDDVLAKFGHYARTSLAKPRTRCRRS